MDGGQVDAAPGGERASGAKPGEVLICGISLRRDATRAKASLGYLPDVGPDGLALLGRPILERQANRLGTLVATNDAEWGANLHLACGISQAIHRSQHLSPGSTAAAASGIANGKVPLQVSS